MQTTNVREEKVYTHGAERERIAARQQRDGLNFGPRPFVPRPMTQRSANYFAARAYLRYAQEALLTGDSGRALGFVYLAAACRNVARGSRW